VNQLRKYQQEQKALAEKDADEDTNAESGLDNSPKKGKVSSSGLDNSPKKGKDEYTKNSALRIGLDNSLRKGNLRSGHGEVGSEVVATLKE
jgi:hypothetical protein